MPKDRRRVSFDEARIEETWLSEHSEPVNPPSPPAPPVRTSLLGLPPRRGRDAKSERRTRSTSSPRSLLVRNAAPKDTQHASTSAGETSDTGDDMHPTLYFEPSQTQLEQNAEAFQSTSALRIVRRALHIWHDTAMQLQQARSQDYFEAAKHDRELLLTQSLDQWRTALDIKRQARRHEERRLTHLEHMEDRAVRYREGKNVFKAFTHWATSCEDERLRTAVGKRHMIRFKYFKRWVTIATENQAKIRRILCRKYLAIWREKTMRRQLWQEQAVAHYEEALVRKCKTRWFWHFCSRRVEGWHEQWVEKRIFGRLRSTLQDIRQQQRDGESLYQSRLARATLQTLRERLQVQVRLRNVAEEHHGRTLILSGLRNLQIQTTLAPLAQTWNLKVSLDLHRKAFRIWHLSLTLSRQAGEVDRKRVLQTAWTNWNDALRCRALGQNIDERVLVENLYRWVLQERLRLFQRTIDQRLLRRAFNWWQAKVNEEIDKLAHAERVFAERQRRRRLAFGMLKMNIAMRDREDGERAALELANSRALPKVLESWKEKTDHARRMAKWAADARFYFLCSATLKVWNRRTSDNQHNRRRDAYAQIRARIKIRLVSRCFQQWRTQSNDMTATSAEAERRSHARVAAVGTRGFDTWRAKSSQCAELQVQATQFYDERLLASALSAVVTKHAEHENMEQEALELQRRNELALLGGAFRRIQWVTFMAKQKVVSADACSKRNGDQHVRQMLRHWASQAAARKSQARDEGEGAGDEEREPDSPSLRPASRAASRSADLTVSSPPPAQRTSNSTPAYLRTPSRSRRAGRFRSLPTPAPFTPMAFNASYLATTPAPLPREPEEPFEGLTPQVTPFERKLRAGGVTPGVPPSALRTSLLGRSVRGDDGTGTTKSVRFAGASRFRSGTRADQEHMKTS